MTRLLDSGSESVVDADPFSDISRAFPPEAEESEYVLLALAGETTIDSASMTTSLVEVAAPLTAAALAATDSDARSANPNTERAIGACTGAVGVVPARWLVTVSELVARTSFG
jgi:hypothetical protein